MFRQRFAWLALGLVIVLISACGTSATPTPTTAPKPAAPPTAAPTSAPAAKPAAAPTAPATTAPTPPAKPAAAKTEPAKALAPLSPVVPVKTGVLGSASDAGIYIALEKGYFKELGLDVTLETVHGGGTDVLPLLATGGLDVSGGGLAAALFNSVKRGVPVRTVADKGSFLPGFGFQSFVVRKDLLDSGKFKEYKDLKGMKVAVNGMTSVDSLLLSKILEKGGLNFNDVETVEMPFPDMLSAFGTKAIDAATIIEPFVTRLVDENLGRSFVTFDKLVPNQQVSTVMYGPPFTQSKPEAAKRFMVAYVKGLRDYNDAFVKNQNKDAVIGILTKNTTIKDAKLWQKITPPGLNPDGSVSKASIAATQDFFASRNLIPDKVDVEQLVDDSYVQFALQQLGKYAR